MKCDGDILKSKASNLLQSDPKCRAIGAILGNLSTSLSVQPAWTTWCQNSGSRAGTISIYFV